MKIKILPVNKIFVTFLFAIAVTNFIIAQKINLDEFENTDSWNSIKSDGVELSISSDIGLHGSAIKFDYDFTKGTGYGGFQKFFPIDLPENFEFTFYIKAKSPSNNFEIKFLDSTGQNVWWVNNRNYDFPYDWKKITIKKRHINFAWGPLEDHSLKRIDRIEFTIASFVGGKGTVWIDDLKFEPLSPETNIYPLPSAEASSFAEDHFPKFILDHSQQTYWQSSGMTESITIDFQVRREFGGIKIDWLKDHEANTFDILLSDDKENWEKVYSVQTNRADVSFINLPESQSRYLRLNLHSSIESKYFGISEMTFLDIRNSLTKNDFLIYNAKNSQIGNYPRYFLEQASYWTIVGVNNDTKEALVNEDGMVEIDKANFSIEPMLKVENKLFNWSSIDAVQSLDENYLPIPTIQWNCGEVTLSTKVFAHGKANKNSTLYIKYSIKNISSSNKNGNLFLLIRPFQVNPYYQFLNLSGGTARINTISKTDDKIIVNDDKIILPITKYDSFGATSFDEGNIVERLSENNFSGSQSSVMDPTGLASGLLSYSFDLKAGEEKIIYLAIPFYSEAASVESLSEDVIEKKLNETINFWKEKVNHIKFNLPESADRIVNTYKSNLAYILINRDNFGIQPGSRSYERSWIRDGSLTSSALLKSGIENEVKNFIDWYTAHQYENGKVPCVVDSRGPDPVPENDSHGEMIYLIREYFNFTHDTTFLRSKNENIINAVKYIESLIAQRSTDHFKNGNDSVSAYYGLVTESISHEGYSAKPMHSYWDNFFTMKGLKDAAEIQKILGEKENYEMVKKIRDTFQENLYNSLSLAMEVRKIDYIPGCVELGDFDATSTTIALTPCNELKNLPRLQVNNTFNKYYDFFKDRRDAKIDWVNYTPYENRLIGSFIQLNEPDKAHELIEFFLNDQRPIQWNDWAEVVWKDYRSPKYIGDMPHTWVGSDFINAIRSMFVFEDEYDSSIVIGAALYQDWIDTPDGMSVENLPTYHGKISYSIKKEKSKYFFSIYGDVQVPKNGIKIKNFNGSKIPVSVKVNGREIKSFTKNEIDVKEFPAKVVIAY